MIAFFFTLLISHKRIFRRLLGLFHRGNQTDDFFPERNFLVHLRWRHLCYFFLVKDRARHYKSLSSNKKTLTKNKKCWMLSGLRSGLSLLAQSLFTETFKVFFPRSWSNHTLKSERGKTSESVWLYGEGFVVVSHKHPTNTHTTHRPCQDEIIFLLQSHSLRAKWFFFW